MKKYEKKEKGFSKKNTEFVGIPRLKRIKYCKRTKGEHKFEIFNQSYGSTANLSAYAYYLLEKERAQKEREEPEKTRRYWGKGLVHVTWKCSECGKLEYCFDQPPENFPFDYNKCKK